MKKIIFILTFFLIAFLSFKIFSNKDFIIETIINFVILKKDNYILIIIINALYFLSPLPVTPLIIGNGFLLEGYSFFILYPIIVIDSLLLFLLSKYMINLNLIKYLKKKKKFIALKKISEKNIAFFISRYTFPYFFHNLYYGLMNISFKKFCYLVILAEIPLTYALIMLGVSLNDFMVQKLDLLDIFLSMNFLLPLFLITIIMILTKYIKRKL